MGTKRTAMLLSLIILSWVGNKLAALEGMDISKTNRKIKRSMLKAKL